MKDEKPNSDLKYSIKSSTRRKIRAYFPCCFLLPRNSIVSVRGALQAKRRHLCHCRRLKTLKLTCLPDLTVPKMGYFCCLSSASYTGALYTEIFLQEACLSESSPGQRVAEASLALCKATGFDLVLVQVLSHFKFA